MSIFPEAAIVLLMTPDSLEPSSLSPRLSDVQTALLRKNFEVVEAQSSISALVFYRHLFTLDPTLRPLFQSGIELQGRKLIEALKFTLATIDNPDELVPILEALGRRHVTYGTREGHYETMTEAMLLTLQETLGGDFTGECEAAWRAALGFINGTMMRGATQVHDLLQETAGPNRSGDAGIH